MNPADTAFIILCATFVMLMTPALALFYGGLVRSKNILSTCMHSYAALGMVPCRTKPKTTAQAEYETLSAMARAAPILEMPL